MKHLSKIIALSLALLLTVMAAVPSIGAGSDFVYAGSEETERSVEETSADDETMIPDAEAVPEAGFIADSEDETGPDDEVSDDTGQKDTETDSDVPETKKESEETTDNTVDAADNTADTADTTADTIDKIEFKGKEFDITIDSSPEAALPAATELDVSEITDGDKEYKEYYEKAIEAAKDDAKGKDTRAVRFVRLYDMTLTADGEIQEPNANVDVTIDYSKAVKKGTAEAAQNRDSVRVIHFKENKKGEIEADLLASKYTDATIEDSALTEAKFEAESFSVYAVVYTVDFHYGDGEYDFSIEGASSIMLSDVIKKLHMGALTIGDVKDVKFSDPELVKVEKMSGEVDAENGTTPVDDWKLTSLKPFSTDETLTLTLNDGSEVVILVTDAPAGDAFEDITSDQIKAAVDNSTEVPFYFLLPDGQTIYPTSYTVRSGRLYEDRNTVSSALNAMNSALGTNYARKNNNFYYVYDAATDTVDTTDNRGDVFTIDGRVYYTKTNETNANLTKAASTNRDNVANNIRNAKSMLLDGDKILIPLKLGGNLTIQYEGVSYTVNAASGAVTATGFVNGYSGTPKIYGEIPYTKGGVTQYFQLSKINNITRSSTKLDFDDSLIDRMFPADVNIPDLILECPEEEELLSQGYTAGSSNDGSYQVWKKADYHDGDIDITLKYFQKQNTPLDFIFVLDETSTTGTSDGSAHGITAPILFWTRAATLKTTKALFDANGEDSKHYQNRVAVVIWDDTYQYSSGFKTSYNDVKSFMSQNYTNTGTTHHPNAIRKALELAKQSYEAEGNRTPVIAYLSDFQIHSRPTHASMQSFTFDGKTGVASKIMREYCLSYGLRVLEDNDESTKNTPTFSTNGELYSSNGTDTDTLLTAFAEIIDDAVGYVSGTATIEDEFSDAMKGIVSRGGTFSSSGDGSANATYQNGKATWPLNNGETDGVVNRLRSGQLITKTLTLTTNGNEVISGSMPTNGNLTVENRNKELNKIPANNSPILKKNVEMVLGVMTEARDKTDRIVQGVKFTLTKNGTQVWEGTTNAVGVIRVPFEDVPFETGSEYILTQDYASTPADEVVIPETCTWKLTVGNDYRITSTKVGADTDMSISGGRFEIWNIEQTEHVAPLKEVIVKKVWDGSVPDYQKQEVPFSIYAEKTSGEKVKVPAYSTDNYADAEVITELTSSDTNWSRSVYVPEYIETEGDLKTNPYTISESSLSVKKADTDTIIGQPGVWQDPRSEVIPGGTTPGQTTYDIVNRHNSGNQLYVVFKPSGWFEPDVNGIRWLRIDYAINGENYRTYFQLSNTQYASSSWFTYYVPVRSGNLLNTGINITGLKYSSLYYTGNEPGWTDVTSDFSVSSVRLSSTGPSTAWLSTDLEWDAQKIFTRKEVTGQSIIGPSTLQITNSFTSYKKLNISSNWVDETGDSASTSGISKVKYDVTVDGHSVQTPEVNKGGTVSVYVPAGNNYSVKQSYYKVGDPSVEVNADDSGSFAPFDLTKSNDSGNFAGDQDVNVTFTNTRKSTSVKVQTVWEPMPANDDPDLDTNITYNLTYTKSDGTSARTPGENNKANGWKMDHNGTFPAYSINGEPTDCSISTAVQQQLSDYDVTVERQETGLHSVVYTIRNKIKNGSITISKIWENGDHGEQDANRPQEITVNVSNGSDINREVTLKASSRWSAMIELPVKQTYTITEEVPDQYVERYEGGSGTDNNEVSLTPAGAIVKVTNKYDPYVLTVTNTAEGEYADRTKEFEYTISGLTEGTKVYWTKQEKANASADYADLENDASGYYTADSNGEVTFILKHLQKVDLNVPTHLAGLTLTQEEYGGYTTKMDGHVTNSKTIGVMNDNVTVNVINEFTDEIVPSGLTLNNWTGRMVFLLVILVLAAEATMYIHRRRSRA